MCRVMCSPNSAYGHALSLDKIIRWDISQPKEFNFYIDEVGKIQGNSIISFCS